MSSASGSWPSTSAGTGGPRSQSLVGPRAAWDSRKAVRTKKPETSEVESSGLEGNGVTAEPEPVIAAIASNPGEAPPDPFLG